MLSTRPARRLAVAVGLTVLALTGCGEGAVRAGAAAVVGGERISADDLRAVVDRGLADPQAAQRFGADRDAFQRQVLARLINSKVLQEAGERNGVTVTPGDVDARIGEFVEQSGTREALEAQAAQSGISAQDLPSIVRDILLEEKLGDALTKDIDVPQADLQAAYDQNLAEYDQVRSRHILVEDEAQARDLLAQVRADPSRFAPLAAQFSIDTSNKDKGGDLGLVGRGAFVPEFEQLLFRLEPGGYDVVQTQFGWHVVNVIERVTTPLSEAEPELRRSILEAERTSSLQEVLRATAADLDITVNSRFGRYDAEAGTVVAEDVPNGVSSPAPGPERAPGPAEGGPPPGQEPPAEQPGEPAQPQPQSSPTS